MLVKFETKSDAVKALSFHCKRPWILVSLYSGIIQLWDYRIGILIDSFDEHRGPVRGVHFHASRPLFVSGGDDKKINVWNYVLRKCLFTFGTHDCVRSVHFHHEQPWIVSAGDDFLIRIWNWQSRTLICVLGGHRHFVMCASFHPKEYFILSASLNGHICIWDIGILKKKTLSPARGIMRFYGIIDDIVGDGGVENYGVEAHAQGVRWASFHPTLPLIVSGACNNQVKIWQMNGRRCRLKRTLNEHMNRVSCVLFHARQEITVLISQDNSIRVWDSNKKTSLQTLCSDQGRFWTLASHPKMNLLAAGHSSGMIVFKLERERPAFSVSGNLLFYVKDRVLCVYEYLTQEDTPLIQIAQSGSNSLNQGPRSISYSPSENAVLVCSDIDGGSYELHTVPKDNYDKEVRVQEAKRGSGGSAMFVAQNRFAVLEKSSNQILLKNLKNEIAKKIVLPFTTDAIFYAGTGNLLCRAEDRVVIWDLQQSIVLGDLQTSFVKYVVYSQDMESIALLSKHSIIIADKKLVHRCTLRETVCIKSGAWDDNGVFIYTTLTHMKYCLPNGESGIVKSLDVPLYITKIYGNTIFCLDRDGKNRRIIINLTEYVLKLSLLRKRYDQVKSMTENSKLCGHATITYLRHKGFPQFALYLAKDERTRFNLALESGHINIALESAKKIDEKDHWYKLGVEALRQGSAGIVEYTYQRLKNFERLSFLHLITGNLDKLSKMMKIAEVRNDVLSHFHYALYLGDIRERVKILENAGHLPLAYITATVHGLHDIAECLATELGDNVPSLPEGRKASLLIPPTPVLCAGDWPLMIVNKGILEDGLDDVGRGAD